MQFKFNSVEEVLEFASIVRRHAEVAPGTISPLTGIDPAALVHALASIARTGNKIQAIKVYRAVTGKGLRESKEAVERAPEFQRPPAPGLSNTFLRDQTGCGDPECGCGPSFEEPDCRREDTPY